MSSPCLNCKVIQQNTRKVPLWSINEGNKSLLPEVIREKKYNPKDSKLIAESPKLTKLNVNVPIKTDKPDTWVFYWAAHGSTNPEKIMQEKEAYGNNSNHGIVKTDDDGNAILKLNCPQPYKEHEKGLTYPRHVHYTFLMKDNLWNENINSLVVMCNIDFKQMQKALDKKTHIILNALPNDEYEKIHIPNSYNMYYKFLEEMPEKDRAKYIESLLKEYIENYPKLSKLLKKNKLSLFDIPIITYCDNIKCKASEKLTEYLIEANYVNVLEYPGGMKDWHENTKISEDDTIPSNIELDDDEEIINYKGGEYLHHKDTNDVTDIEDFSLLGTWDPKLKKISWLNTNDIDMDDEELKENKEDIIDIVASKYKHKITVVKKEPDIVPDLIDEDIFGGGSNSEEEEINESSSEEIEDEEIEDETSDEEKDETSDETSDEEEYEDETDETSDEEEEDVKVDQVEIENMKGGDLVKKKTILSDYHSRGFNFF